MSSKNAAISVRRGACVRRSPGDGERSDNALARFVGVDVYKAAGGQLVTDLFEERAYLSDSDLLRQLASEKLGKSAERLRKREAWKTIDVGIDAARDIFNLNRLQPQPVGVPPEVTEALRQAVEERDAIEASDEEWTEASEAAFDTLYSSHSSCLVMPLRFNS